MLYESLDEFLRDLPVHAARNADKLRGHDGVFLLKTKQGRTLYIRLQNGEVTTAESMDAKPLCTVHADESALLDLICGRLNPMKALLLRRVTVEGNPAALMSLIALL